MGCRDQPQAGLDEHPWGTSGLELGSRLPRRASLGPFPLLSHTLVALPAQERDWRSQHTRQMTSRAQPPLVSWCPPSLEVTFTCLPSSILQPPPAWCFCRPGTAGPQQDQSNFCVLVVTRHEVCWHLPGKYANTEGLKAAVGITHSTGLNHHLFSFCI